jgi:catechol 2,3-dioxygenase-like lactoylglutathione lyase family enzyme
MTVQARLPDSAEKRGRVAPARLAHFVRKTSRFSEMLDWYKTVLEAEVVFGTEIMAFLTYDEEHHRLALLAIPGLTDPPPNATGTDHIAFAYSGMDDLVYTYKRLRDEGIEPFWCINHGPTTSFYYKDPDGNGIEMQVDNFATIEETNSWLRGGEFDENPIGIVFEPEEFVAQFEAGVPLSELTRRPPLPEGKTPFDMVRF